MYKLTQTGISKARQALDKILPEVYTTLQRELAADSSGRYNTLVDFTDFSQVNLLLFSEDDDWYYGAQHTHRTDTAHTFSTLTFKYPYLTRLKVVFLFQCQPGKSILPDQSEPWSLLTDALETGGLSDEVSYIAFLNYPEAADFADVDTAQMLRVRIELYLEDADIESV